ncbi:uncharacterized protein AMSG_07647 [Thecamonas trahens ATCC 50062]|uniref:Uncharacterized protein n=1 Tax=Thecamonas trahens ATCC 50062 TaxID=461836 RepID=A0A0L0DGJ2_THETB|nr:hypothetical protein AMSG_07647 [Thecamonas trahens ATCC 50062]KNC51452.1 hypothetical protein AMSG_07647 [Thecamonas trahens ATCC 50062]|eukprot:XP_013756114.1 hypothetical protein AMSG_07647 [Thecamonas trahens ATCC 50062]
MSEEAGGILPRMPDHAAAAARASATAPPRNVLAVDDIQGAKSKSHYASRSIRNPLQTDDIDGAHTAPAPPFRRNPLAVADINNACAWRSTRQTNPLNPQYVMGPPRVDDYIISHAPRALKYTKAGMVEDIDRSRAMLPAKVVIGDVDGSHPPPPPPAARPPTSSNTSAFAHKTVDSPRIRRMKGDRKGNPLDPDYILLDGHHHADAPAATSLPMLNGSAAAAPQLELRLVGPHRSVVAPPPFAVDSANGGAAAPAPKLRPALVDDYYPSSQRNVYIPPARGRNGDRQHAVRPGTGHSTMPGFGIVSAEGGTMFRRDSRPATAASPGRSSRRPAAATNPFMVQELAYGAKTTSIPPAYYKPFMPKSQTTMHASHMTQRQRRQQAERQADIELVASLPL